MSRVLINQCNDCVSLKDAYGKIECTILDLMSNKYANISYNVSMYYSQPLMNRLRRYRRVFLNKIFNPDYTCVSQQDMVKLAQHFAYKDNDCSRCALCFPENPTTTQP